MKLVVGLGNPGKEYENTRHNCGFKAIDYYSKINNLNYKKKFNSEYCENIVNNEKIILVKPLTYMNNSGSAVIKFINYYDVKINDILVIYDDINFEIGKFKIKRGGSSAGHNGIKSIISNIKTEDLYRVKIGISKNNISLENYVLSKFNKDEELKLNKVLDIISNVIYDFSIKSIDELMEKYNKNNE